MKKMFDINDQNQTRNLPLVLFFMHELKKNKKPIRFVYNRKFETLNYPVYSFYKPISRFI